MTSCVMGQYITETQKSILHQAVDTGDASFIAQCVYAIEEILEAINALTSCSNEDTVSHNDKTHDDVEIKLEPDDGETDARSECAQNENTTSPTDSPQNQRTERAIPSQQVDVEWHQSDKKKVRSYQNEYRCTQCQFVTDTKFQLAYHVDLQHGKSIDQNAPASDTQKQISNKKSRTKSSGVDNPESTETDDEWTNHSPLYIISSEDEARSTHTSANSHPIGSANSQPAEKKTRKRKYHINPEKRKTSEKVRKNAAKSHPDDDICCDQCDFTTKKKSNYKQHLRTHLAPEDKPHKCDQCDYSSNSKEGLEMHDNSQHKGVRPFLCDLCGSSFTGISMLSKHKLMKHKPKHLSCPHCDYKTSLQTWLKDHMRKHSKESPFKCTYCNYTAKSAGRLKVHIRIHTGERPYKCHMCQYAAVEGAPLKKHLKTQHDIIVSRIDVREGKLFLQNGDVIETGLIAKIAPLPQAAYQKGAGTSNVITVVAQESDTKIPVSLSPGTVSSDDLTHTANIIAQAASLSAIPVVAGSLVSPAVHVLTETGRDNLSDGVYSPLLLQSSSYQPLVTTDTLTDSHTGTTHLSEGQIIPIDKL